MSPTIFLDLFLMFALGMLFPAMLADRFLHTERHRLFRNAAFYWILFYGMLFGYGTGVICYLMAPDWMWMYWVDSRRVSALVLAGVSAGYLLSWVAGVMTGRELLTSRRGLRWGLTLAWGVPAMIVVVFFNRVWHIGSLEQFQHGQAAPMLNGCPVFVHPVVWVMNLAVVLAIAALLLMLRYFKPRKEV